MDLADHRRQDVHVAPVRRHRQVFVAGRHGAGARGVGRRDDYRRGAAREHLRPIEGIAPRLHRHVEVLPPAEHRRLLHGRRSGADGAARPRGRAVELGEARSDRRRAHAVSGQRGADRGDARPGARRVRRAALHERRSGRLPQARGRGRRGGHAARRADRIRPRHPERQQPAHHPRVRARAAHRRRRRRHRVGRGAGDGARRRRRC